KSGTLALVAISAPAVDGRAVRSSRTRAAIVDALIELLLSGEAEPTAQQIAEAASVSVRTVYGHFRSLGDLHQAVVEKVSGLILEQIHPIDTSEALDVRIALVCGQRARINEEFGPILRAAERDRHTSAELGRAKQVRRQASTLQIARVFAAELDPLDPGSRSRRIASIDVQLSLYAWDSLRHDHGL